jgi:hypothetical protein
MGAEEARLVVTATLWVQYAVAVGEAGWEQATGTYPVQKITRL